MTINTDDRPDPVSPVSIQQEPHPEREEAATDTAITPPRVEAVIVTYRSAANLRELFPLLEDDLAVVVVDNSGNSDGMRELAAQRPNTRYVTGGGVGFARAANLGARTSRAEYLIFLNPDARPTAGTLNAIVDDVAADPTRAITAAMPAQAEGDRGQIGAGGWEPTLSRALIHAIGLHKLMPKRGLFAEPKPHPPIQVDWVTGACAAVRRETFLRLGSFDEQFYVYNEDVAFGRRVREAGLTSRLRTDLPVPAGEGGSGAPSREMLRLRGASMTRYLAQHNDPRRVGAMVGLLSIGSLARALAATVRGRKDLAVGYLEYTWGLISRRASVGGKRVY